MKKGIWQFILGFTAGALMFGGTVAYAAGVLATSATNRIIVDGREIKAEAYNIEGRNYLQLRDLAAAVNFSVVWDGPNNQVLIDTSRGYDPNETLPAPVTPAPTPAPAEPEQAAAPAMSIDEMKAEIIRLTNEERVKAGLSKLEVLPALMDCAQIKADDMLDNHYFGHTSPKYGSANDMVKDLVPGYRGACENINLGGITPTEVITGWVESDEHYKNLLDSRVTHIGIGIAENSSGALIWVQQLMRK